MIDSLKPHITYIQDGSGNIVQTAMAPITADELVNKINEIIDVVNGLDAKVVDG